MPLILVDCYNFHLLGYHDSRLDHLRTRKVHCLPSVPQHRLASLDLRDLDTAM